MEKTQAPAAKSLKLTARMKEKLEPLAALDQVSNTLPVDKFLHSVAEGITGRTIDWKGIFGEEFEEVQPIVNAYALFFTKVVGSELKGEEIAKEIVRFGVPSDHQALVREVLVVHYLPIQKALVLDTSKISSAYLKDFDWQLQMVMASDKISYSRDPVLRLSLTLGKDDGTTKDVFLELSKEELGKFIASLTDANKVVKELQV